MLFLKGYDIMVLLGGLEFMNILNKDGWLFDNPERNEIHFVSAGEFEQFFELAELEQQFKIDKRIETLKLNEYSDKSASSFILAQIGMLNIGGTISCAPYGMDVLSFPSTRHLFRGENQLFERSIPSLNRKIYNKSEFEKLMWSALAFLRVEQFYDFIWRFDIIRFWCVYFGNVNIKALAQHYGFDTHLIDLTNDILTALFFATCKYNSQTDSYEPLTQKDISEHPYGIIFHTPNWRFDYNNTMAGMKVGQLLHEHKIPCSLESGYLDNIAFQIGYQPFMRCHAQNGYVLPMIEDRPLQKDWQFEKICFRHSVDLSQKIFNLMDSGRKVFPNEGIIKVRNVIDKIKTSYNFYVDSFKIVYTNEALLKNNFSNFDEFLNQLLRFNFDGKNIIVEDKDVEYYISEDIEREINSQYSNFNLNELVGGPIYQKPEHRKYREERFKFLRGKLNI